MTRRARVASAGEALVDLFAEDDETGPFLRVKPGGSPLNVAIGLARLGLETSFAGRLSTDAFGRLLADTLEREGVGTGLVQRGAERTALAIVADGRGDVAYDFRWAGTADRAYDPGALPAGSFETLDALHVGSVAIGLDPAGGRLVELLERLRGTVFLGYDPNIRRDVVDDWPTYVERVRRVAMLADLVKVSDADLAALGEPAPPDGIPFGRRGPTVVTAGDRGATLVQPGRPPIAVPAVSVDVVDAVGAGDSAMAALLFSLAEQGELAPGGADDLPEARWREILRVMTTAAAMTCERIGADPPAEAALRARLGT